MLSLANERGILYSTVLIDTGYATSQIMVRLQNEGKIFYCPIKVNLQVDESSAVRPYQSVESLAWTEEELKCGKKIKIKKTSKHMKVQLFRVTISNRTEYIITNDLSQVSAEETLEKSSFRWKIEQLHREEKQLTGIERCQARNNRSQRNHILCCTLVWLFISHAAHQQKTTTYQVKKLMEKVSDSTTKKAYAGFCVSPIFVKWHVCFYAIKQNRGASYATVYDTKWLLKETE
ncbi:MAG: transposase [Bacteroidetes bacterium]|nr:transposase [Bacteroidota bacterium]